MRKGFNGLYGLVSSGFGEDPRSGALYVFCNRRHTRIKVLYFDGTGLWVLSKRLERGTFSWPKPSQEESPTLKLSPEAFAMLTDGVDLRGAKLRPWYERERGKKSIYFEEKDRLFDQFDTMTNSVRGSETPGNYRAEGCAKRLLQAENERQSQEIKLLKEKIDLLIRGLLAPRARSSMRLNWNCSEEDALGKASLR